VKRKKNAPEVVVSYALFLHGKAGDDFACLLRRHRGNAVKALHAQAEQLRKAAKACLTLAKGLKGARVHAVGGASMIGFEPLNAEAVKRLDALMQKKLLTRIEIPIE
jgi:hypothetical protein